MQTEYNVGDLVAEFLAACGVRTVFGVVSVHNIPMLDGIGRRNAIRFVMARGEMGGGHMADAYARVSGGLGVLISSTGPGAANAVPGLVEAQFAGTPLLHLTGQSATKFAGRGAGTVHDPVDQSGMLRAVGKSAYRVRAPAEALGVLTRAAVDALTPPTGPVSVEIPIDIQRAPVERPALLDQLVLPLPPPRAPAAQEIEELAAIVARARRPMLWLGSGAREAGAPARRLLDLGFGMVTSWAGRGVVPEDHPMNLGALNGNGAPIVQDFYRTVDLLLVAGSRLRGQETGEFAVRLPENLVQIDIDPLANGRTYPSRFFVCGDAKLTLEALCARIGDRLRVDPEFSDDFRRMKQQARAAFQATLGPYASFPDQLREAMPRDAVWVRDVTISNTSWGNRLFPLLAPRSSVYPISTAIGPGLPMAIGAALAAPGRKVVLMSGDGGFAVNMSELWTAVQERLDLVMIVMNDRGYGVIRHIQDALYGGRRFYGDLLSPDLGGLAALAGLPFRKVDRADGFGAAVQAALQAGGPALVEVDMTAIGEHPPYHPWFRSRPA